MLTFCLLQSSRNMESSFQIAFIIGLVFGGLIFTRVVSWVLRFVLVKTVMKGNTIGSIQVGHGVTFVICSVGLWLMLSTPRETYSDAFGNRYRQSSDYPWLSLVIYGVCIVIWLCLDIFLANRKARKADDEEFWSTHTR